VTKDSVSVPPVDDKKYKTQVQLRTLVTGACTVSAICTMFDLLKLPLGLPASSLLQRQEYVIHVAPEKQRHSDHSDV